MKKLLMGTVNGKAFTLFENGKVDCEDSELSRLISDRALGAIKHAAQEIIEEYEYRLVWKIRDELEKCRDAKIKVNKAFDYEGGTMLIFHYHLPCYQDYSRRPFLSGRFNNGKKFKVLVNYDVEVSDTDAETRDEKSLLEMDFIFIPFQVKLKPKRNSLLAVGNYDIYKVLKEDRPELSIERAYFYHRDSTPDMID